MVFDVQRMWRWRCVDMRAGFKAATLGTVHQVVVLVQHRFASPLTRVLNCTAVCAVAKWGLEEQGGAESNAC